MTQYVPGGLSVERTTESATHMSPMSSASLIQPRMAAMSCGETESETPARRSFAKRTDLDGHAQALDLVAGDAEDDEHKVRDEVDDDVGDDAGGPGDGEPEGPDVGVLLDDAGAEAEAGDEQGRDEDAGADGADGAVERRRAE